MELSLGDRRILPLLLTCQFATLLHIICLILPVCNPPQYGVLRRMGLT